MTIEPGQLLSHYRLIEMVGHGGMGEVWKAEDTRLHRHVALKLVPESGDRNAGSVDRHLREARAASALNHPHICAIHDIGEWEGRRFIVMELLEGRGLNERIDAGALDIGTAVELAIQIADALATAHAKGIVHRDIKPANIFLTDRGQAKVLDFGLAKFADANAKAAPDDETRTRLESTNPGSVMGTVAYMSPEQALGRPLDARSDLFSLGVVLYEMITGRRAFTGTTSAAVFDAILNRAPTAPVELNPDVPAELERIVNKALEKDPALRYQGATDLIADLQRWRREPSAPAATTPTTGRRAGKIVWVLVAAAFLLLAGLWAVLPRGDAGGEQAEAVPRSAVTGVKLAVLPFVNASGDEAQRYFVDGLTSEIVTELSRYGELAVMPCRSGSCAGEDADPRAIGDEIGARYVLGGRVQSSENLIRVNVNLYDGRDGRTIWSNTIDSERTARDLFDLQDQLSLQVVNAVAGSHGAVTRAELPAARRKPPESLASHDCVFRAYDYLQNSHTAEFHKAARDCLERVVESEPNYVDGLAWLAYLYADQYHHRWHQGEYTYDPLARAMEKGERAVFLDDSNVTAHTALGLASLFAGDVDRGISELKRAAELEPRNLIVVGLIANYLANHGEFDIALPLTQKSLDLSPHPPRWFGYPRFAYHYANARYEQAVALARRNLMGSGDFRDPLFLAAALGKLGRKDEAAPVIELLRERWAVVCQQAGCEGLHLEDLRRELIDRHAFSVSFADALMDGLRSAGLEEDA